MRSPTLASHIARFGSCFDLFQKIGAARCGVQALDRLSERPLDALFFFTFYCHERQGRDPKFATLHRAAVCRALGSKRYAEELNPVFTKKVLEAEFSKQVWRNFCAPLEKRNERQTKGPVRQILSELRKEGTPNLVALLLRLGVKKALAWLLEIKGIGPKIASLVVRDCFSFSGVVIPAADQELVQPVDRWVLFWAKQCWKRVNWGKLKKPEEKARRITQYCQAEGVDPIAFNKGAWFLGAQFSQLRALHGLPEAAEADRARAEAIRSFDPERTMRAMRAFHLASQSQEMLVLY